VASAGDGGSVGVKGEVKGKRIVESEHEGVFRSFYTAQ